MDCTGQNNQVIEKPFFWNNDILNKVEKLQMLLFLETRCEV
jgi:hypothetical protein